MSLTLHGLPLSPFVRKARVLMHEMGVDYDLKIANPFAPDEWFLANSPLKRIPLLTDSDHADWVLSDSSAICLYLDKKFADGNSLFPDDTRAFGDALWIEEYADTAFAMVVGMDIFRLIFFNQMQGKAPDVETATKNMTEKMPKFFNYFEKQLGDNAFLVGNAFSIADISVVSQICNLTHAGFGVDATACPKLAAYVDVIMARPSFAEIFASEKAAIGA